MKRNELLKLVIARGNTPSVLSQVEIDHFRSDGKFYATYNPTKLDVSGTLKDLIGRRVTIYRNYELTPCMDAIPYTGQFKFFIEGFESCGWCPECDFQDFVILPATKDDISRWESNHQYLMGYNDRESCISNFGNYGKTCDLPLIVGRSYDYEKHKYVKDELCNPKPEVIIYRNYPGEWTEI